MLIPPTTKSHGYPQHIFMKQSTIQLIPRKEKITFLMKSGLFKKEKLEEKKDIELNDLFKAGLAATNII